MKQKQKIAFIKARWHAEIVDRAFEGFTKAYSGQHDVEGIDVPGAFEMPLLAKRLALTGHYSSIVCAAFVVDGGIYRHDFVSKTVVDGLMQVQLETDVPVFSVSLTPHHFQPTQEHVEFFKAHFVTKGQEAAGAVQMIEDL